MSGYYCCSWYSSALALIQTWMVSGFRHCVCRMRLLKFRLDHSICRTHSGTHEITWIHSKSLLDCERCLATTVVDAPSSPERRPGWVEVFIVGVRCAQPFGYRLDHSIGRTHSMALEHICMHSKDLRDGEQRRVTTVVDAPPSPSCRYVWYQANVTGVSCT